MFFPFFVENIVLKYKQINQCPGIRLVSKKNVVIFTLILPTNVHFLLAIVVTANVSS